MRSSSQPRRSRRPLRSPFRLRRGLFYTAVVVLLLTLGYHELESALHKPQAVLVLGGEPMREVFAAEFAREHPTLPVWVSSGTNPEYAEWVFARAGNPLDRLHLDYQARDTVTNFTTLVDRFKAEGITSIYLITSDYHMRRASVIGEIVLGSRGIDFKPVVVPSERSPEPVNKVVRDAARATLWVITGNTGSNFAQFLSKH